jgi:hypothetical protein
MKPLTLKQRADKWSTDDFERLGKPHYHCSESKERAYIAGYKAGARIARRNVRFVIDELVKCRDYWREQAAAEQKARLESEKVKK